jgi:hypothetical protein
MEVTKEHRILWRLNEAGRSRIGIECPFCKARVVAYVWSLAGSGKRCECGALHLSGGCTKGKKK